MEQAKNLRLRYSGNDVSEGMDPFIFIKSVEGFSNYLNNASAMALGKDHKPDFKIRRVQEGSLSLEFIMKVIEEPEMIKSSVGAMVSIMDLVKQGIDLTRHLKGQPPKGRERLGGGKIEVTNNDGEIKQYNIQTENLILNMGGAKNAESFARMPLINEASELAIEADDYEPIFISQRDSKEILPIDGKEEVLENTNETHLSIIKPVLEGKSKWTFSNGVQTFSAPILDKEFLSRVASGTEAFARGDLLLVELTTTQTIKKGKLHAEFEVVRVLEHVVSNEEERPLDFNQ